MSTDIVRAQLGLWDAISVIVGIVVGAALFRAPPVVFSAVAGPWQALVLWLLGGLLSLVGGLCYSELATSYPRVGGDYVYLSRAFGRPVGFLFGWVHLLCILTASAGALAFLFADYCRALLALGPSYGALLAALSVVTMTLINMFGVRAGKTTQNTLTLLKLLGLAAVVLCGFGWAGAEGGSSTVAPASEISAYGQAMVLVLYAYGGWNDAAFVAAEVRDPSRNMPLALIGGTVAITALYLLVNAAYWQGLGFAAARVSSTPAADVLGLALGDAGQRAMSLLVLCSALGALNGLILTGSRVPVAVGADHRLFSWLGHWSARWRTPTRALLVQCVATLALIGAVGTEAGRSAVDALFGATLAVSVPWARFGGGFETLVAAGAPLFWSFFLLTGLALFVLRRKDARVARPFSVPLYPLTPLLFCLSCAYMLYASVRYAGLLTLPVVGLAALGLPLYFLSERLDSR